MSVTRQGLALPLDVRSLVVSFLRKADRRSVERASRAWLQAVWNGPPRMVVHDFASFVRLAALLTSYRLDLYPPEKLEFRSAVEPNVEMPQVDPLLASECVIFHRTLAAYDSSLCLPCSFVCQYHFCKRIGIIHKEIAKGRAKERRGI